MCMGNNESNEKKSFQHKIGFFFLQYDKLA